jgi:3-hydroxyisobutyrate dehydrogenase
LAKDVDVLFLMLGFPKDLEDTCLGESGIIKQMKKGSILVDHTTSKPGLAEILYQECKKYEVGSIDAPVSGGDIGAREGKLVTMCGG